MAEDYIGTVVEGISDRMITAAYVAKAAGNKVLELKDDSTVFDADMVSTKIIVDGLHEAYSNDGIICEEDTPINIIGTSGYQWRIEPLDGTTNYERGLSHYTISIGCLKEGKPFLGVLYLPEVGKSGICFYGEQGARKTFDFNSREQGEPIRVSEKSELKDAHIACYGFDSRLQDLIKTGARIKMTGTTAGDLGYLASGTFDAVLGIGITRGDALAGAAIVELAGGKVTAADGKEIDWTGTGPISIIAANNEMLHKKILDVYNWKKERKMGGLGFF